MAFCETDSKQSMNNREHKSQQVRITMRNEPNLPDPLYSCYSYIAFGQSDQETSVQHLTTPPHSPSALVPRLALISPQLVLLPDL